MTQGVVYALIGVLAIQAAMGPQPVCRKRSGARWFAWGRPATPETESSEGYDLNGVVETALARALVLAAEAKRWNVVAQIADELQRRGTAPRGASSG